MSWPKNKKRFTKAMLGVTFVWILKFQRQEITEQAMWAALPWWW
jgi:hypothetical protein